MDLYMIILGKGLGIMASSSKAPHLGSESPFCGWQPKPARCFELIP